MEIPQESSLYLFQERDLTEGDIIDHPKPEGFLAFEE